MSEDCAGLTRRQFFAAAGSALAAGPFAATATGAMQLPEGGLRVIAYNVLSFTGWPKDRPLAEKAVAREQMPARIAQELALYDPHIVCFAESPDEADTKEVADRLGMHHIRFPSGGYWPGTLLSKFPITSHSNAPVVGGDRPEDLFTRHWGRAELQMPGGETLIVHSAHLHPSEAEVRKREIRHMQKAMQDEREANRPTLLIGDLNLTPDSGEYDMWMQAGWRDTFAALGKGEGYTIPADQPAKRIDYVLAHGPIASRAVEARPLFQGAFRTNPDDPASFALSDHLPQYARFK
jgi:endonuclease/exonuclease/phosphatase family metal-dependent hydrolase